MSEVFKIEIPPGMDSPDLPREHRLRSLITTSLKRKGATVEAPNNTAKAYWTAGHFGLDSVSCFRALPSATQNQILIACSDALLQESYFIEKGGMHYTAKISLLARSTEERLMYNLFAAEEAQHFHWISSFLREDLKHDPTANPFLNFLSEIAQYEDRESLMFTLQVVLEGWGLHHYRALADGCSDPTLKAVFERILKDEAGHHGGGLVLFNEAALPQEKVDSLVDILRRFMPMVQVGPQMVAGVLFRYSGVTDFDSRKLVFDELNAQAETTKKLSALESCIRAARHGDEIADRLRNEGYFHALDSASCASVSLNG